MVEWTYDKIPMLGKLILSMQQERMPDDVIKRVASKTTPEGVTLDDVAILTGKSYRTVQRYVEDGTLREVGRDGGKGPNGGRIKVHAEDVVDLIKSPRRPGPPKRDKVAV